MKRPDDNLASRIALRKSELVGEIIEHKKNSSRYGAAEAIDRLAGQLSELAQILGTQDASDVGEHARHRLADWVAR